MAKFSQVSSALSPSSSSRPAGVLYVVATPIGHLGELSPRVREVLERAALVLAEDTRRTRALLRHLGMNRPLLSLHAHNEAGRLPGVLERLRDGDDLALVSDAGTPLVSDPGASLVAAAHEAGVRVSPVAGPSAVTAALSVAGFPSERFRFEGFLPTASAARRRRLEALRVEGTPATVLYEAPHRLLDALEDARRVLGDGREAVLAHELTKIHETVVRAPLAEHLRRLRAAGEPPRGEYVLVIGPAPARDAGPEVTAEIKRALRLLAEELPPARAAALAVRLWGVDRRRAYALLTGKDGDGG
jgi:16S rRNA (cytidine1402-2'-O)-methyltransferase